MGGGGGKKKRKRPQVQHAPLMDYSALMKSANEQAATSAKAQVQAQIDAYPQLEALQLGTIQRIADNLNNQYTRDAMAGVNRTVGDAATVRGIGGDMRGTAAEIQGIGRLLQARADETNIERQLRQQAEAELGLGRSLSAEETRDAQQSARAAFAARGLGTSMGSSAAEILNRDSYAQARESNRRNFAAATNQMVSGNVFNRFSQAAGLFGNAAQVQQGAANAFAQGANIDANAAQMRANLDPYARALGNASIGANLGNNLQSSIGNTFGNAQQMAGNVSSFNINAIDSRNNAAMNNWAAMRSAQMQAGAANNSATMGMIGTGVGAAVGIGVIAI
jgi:hypothetical protein